MKISRLALPIAVGLVLAAGTLAGLAKAAGSAYREVALPDASQLEEIHMGADGKAWVSDFSAGHIWQIDPATFSYRRFNGLPGVIDAQTGPGGYVWWEDIYENHLGRLEIATGQVTTWTLGIDSINGLAFDEQGRVWVGAYHTNKLIRFDPVSHQSCEFVLSNDNGGYMVAHAGAIWYGNEETGLGRFNPTTNVNTFWDFGIDFGAWSVGANNEVGIWFVHDGHALVGRLDPVLNQISYYSSTVLNESAMVLPRGYSVWFTDDEGLVVLLDPSASQGTTKTVAVLTETVTPTCVDAGPGVTHNVTILSGGLTVTSGTFTSTVENGMTHYTLPDGSRPYGLADINGDLWVVDLNRFSVMILDGHRVRLPAISR